jgi:hypothetical protein
MPLMAISGKSRIWVMDPVLDPIAGVELPKKVFTSRARWMPLIVELKASANMFYPLKNLLYFNFVILKLKCNNLNFNEIRAWMLCMCVCCIVASSRITWSRSWKMNPHFWGGSITTPHRQLIAATVASLLTAQTATSGRRLCSTSAPFWSYNPC